MAAVAAQSPPIVPISNSQSAPSLTTTVVNSSSSASSQPPIATPAFRSFINKISDTVRNGLSQRRPWAELSDRSAFSKPESVSEAALRLRKNYTYFRVNYMAVVAAIVAFSLVSHPISLMFLVGLLASWIFLYLFRPADQPLVFFGRTFTDMETLGMLVVFSAFVVFLTNVGSVLISAVMLGVAIVCAHGSFRVPEDLFLDEQEPSPATGFLSFLGGAATNVAATTAARV
ncbi:PRA1 family protein B4 [Linum grandiflorum]